MEKRLTLANYKQPQKVFLSNLLWPFKDVAFLDINFYFVDHQ